MSRNLVYLCVFFNKKFIDLFSLFLESYVLYNNNKNGDIDLMVMTNPEFERTILNLANKFNVNIFVKTMNLESVFQSKISRLKIFDYSYISNYKNILYLDTDILISGDLKCVFCKELDENLYVVREGDIGNNFHGKFLFDKINNKIDYKRPAFNSGVLLFKNCEKIRRLFDMIYNAITSYTDESVFLSQVDQPFFNYYTLMANLEDMNYLNSLSTNNPNGRTSHVICHFAGNDSNKYDMINKVLQQLKDEMV